MKIVSVVSILFVIYFTKADSRRLDTLRAPADIENRNVNFDVSDPRQRIVGGQEIEITATPYQAGITLLRVDGPSHCGGSLVSSNRVLTAAHCAFDWKNVPTLQYIVRLGSKYLRSGGITRTTTDIVIHPGYNSVTIENDIAMLRIGAVTFSASIQPIALPSGDEISKDYVDALAIASGFGQTYEGELVYPNIDRELRKVELGVVTNRECSGTYNIIVDSTICARSPVGAGICSGDSGGPLAVESNGRNILIGVTSFSSIHGCDAGVPQGYARVTSFLPFIKEHIEN